MRVVRDRLWWIIEVLLILALLSCGTTRDSAPDKPVDVSNLPDAIPKYEPRTAAGNKSPYTVLGKTYHVLPDSKGYRETGMASWYGTKFHGRKTSNGETYDMYAMTAAHKTLPIPSYVRVTNLDNGRSAVVRINDRGPFHEGRIIDLSYAAATKLGYAGGGTTRVEVVALEPGDYKEVPDNSVQYAVSEEKAVEPQIAIEGRSTDQSDEATVSIDNYHLPGNTYLQAGAFASLSKAEEVRHRISLLTDYEVLVRTPENGYDTLYRVYIGPLIDNLDLLRLREILIQQELGVPHLVYQ
jgi:rare lipoprotein A